MTDAAAGYTCVPARKIRTHRPRTISHILRRRKSFLEASCVPARSADIGNDADTFELKPTTSCCSNDSDGPHRRGVTPLLRVIGCVRRARRLDASIVQ